MEKKLNKRVLILLEQYIKEVHSINITITTYTLTTDCIYAGGGGLQTYVIPLLEFNLFMIDNTK